MHDNYSKILQALAEKQRIDVGTLAKLLDVSQVTVRKYLDNLDRRGIISREHGYACLKFSGDTEKRLACHYDVKRRIARAAAETVIEGEAIMLESGSCCALLAEELCNTRRDVTIITNSVFIANYVRNAPFSKVVLLGGYFQNDSQVLVSPITHKCAEIFYTNKFFIGVDGFNEKLGFTGRDYQRAQTIRTLAEQADNVIVLTESEKFSHQGVICLVDPANVTDVYTDDKIPEDKEIFLLDKEVNIHKVNSEAA
jgi:DeoR/GlpR family transcriptional regulator of sugar metabolism